LTTFLIDDQIDRSKWENFILESESFSVFQSPQFYDLSNETPNQSAKVFAVEDHNNIKALCVVVIQKGKSIISIFSKRGIIFGGPIINKGHEKYLGYLLELIKRDLMSRTIYLETRNFYNYSHYNETFKQNSWTYMPYLNFQLDIKGKKIEELTNSMKYNRRREIKISLNEGAKYRIATNIEQVNSVYKILLELYNKRVKLPLPDIEFFQGIFKSSIGKVFIVEHNNNIIGGSFCIYYPENTIYTMYYCGIRDYCPKIYPTHLAILAVMDFGINNNMKSLDFMGAGLPDKAYGVRKYKSEFGGQLVEHGRFLKINNSFLFEIGKIGIEILKTLKTRFTI